MKNTLFILAIVALGLSQGCKKKLELEPQSVLNSQSFYTSAANARAGVSGVYNILARDESWSGGVWAFQDISSDDADQYGRPSSAGDMDNFTLFPNNTRALSLWDVLYDGVTRANLAIANLPAVADMPSQEKERLIGECKYLRALYYFTLHQVFGAVPVFDKPLAITELYQGQAPVSQLWALIESDLKSAESVLPPRAEEPGRVTKGAALALLAKAYLYQKNWEETHNYAEKVIKLGVYRLLPNFKDAVLVENNAESVFEIQFIGGLAGGWNNYNVGGSYQNWTGPGFVGGWDANPVSEDLYKAYPANDLRRKYTILAIGDTFTSSRPFKIYTAKNAAYPFTPRKFLDPTQTVSGLADNGVNVKLMRYSEVLLMDAEALIELNRLSEAKPQLDTIRSRAGLSKLPEGLSQSAMRDTLREERRRELALEWNRFSDLVRWDIAEQVLKAKGKNNFVKGRNEHLPIPQRQIDLSKGALKQNPGY